MSKAKKNIVMIGFETHTYFVIIHRMIFRFFSIMSTYFTRLNVSWYNVNADCFSFLCSLEFAKRMKYRTA